MTTSYDLVVRDATLVDGTGAARRPADVAVLGGRIAAIADAGALPPHRAAASVDAGGLCLAPGFIDSHTHSDVALLGDPDAWPKVSQGVTTEVVGNCGWSTVPGGHRHSTAFERQGRPIFGHGDVDWTWRDLDGYVRALGRRGTAVNVAALVGHGALRAAVMGFDDRPATSAELEAMASLLAAAMRQGAFGLSTGLAYAPGCYAPTSELVELARVVAAHGGLYATHLRDQADGLVASVEEALAIGEGAALPVLVSHHKTVGPRNFGTVRTTLTLMDEQHARGLATYSDVYPYLAGSSTMLPLLPPWVLSELGTPLAVKLRDPALRARIRRDLAEGVDGWENRAGTVGWDRVFVARVASERHRDVVGRSLAELGHDRGVDPADVMMDLLADEDGEVSSLIFNSCEDDLVTVLRHPRTMVGSDGLDVGDKPHPRLFGTFPRVLGRYVREAGILELEDAVHKMTGLTADVFGLADRGRIADGHVADLVLFDPDAILDAADYDHPTRAATGVLHVWVAGRAGLENGRPTGERPGRALRHRSTHEKGSPCP